MKTYGRAAKIWAPLTKYDKLAICIQQCYLEVCHEIHSTKMGNAEPT